MVDAVVPEDADVDAFAATFLRETLPGIDRTPPADLSDPEPLRELILPMVRKATLGRPNPRAPYVAVDVMIRGAQLPLREAIGVERDAFVELATGSEAKAGMRFFFTQQSVQKPPRSLNAKPRELRRIGIDGIDGYMGNAIAWLALEAGYEVVGHAPLAKFAAAAPERLRAKYARAIKRGKRTESQVDERVASVRIVAEDPTCLADCDLVVEARMENRELKAEFFQALGACIKTDALVASNSSSMGPGMLGSEFQAGGGDARNFVNLHFFSPAEHPAMQLVEIIRGADTTDEAVATAHAFVRKIGKTPVILADGSPGFLVNAGLAAYFAAAEELYREGTDVETIDAAVREAVLPMGPFELADQAGLDICAGMYDTLAAENPPETEPLVWKMRELGRFGVKSGEGYYAYDGPARKGEWSELAALVPGRGSRVADSEEIVRRCTRALYDTAKRLCENGIVASEEEADLAYVFGIGFAMHLGGPIYYGRLEGWDH
jgi:3-hydroxyacyl-CoA dehydrogenase